MDKKIRINTETVNLTRNDLAIVKKFLLLAMLRTTDAKEYLQQRKENIAKKVKEELNFEEKNTEDIFILFLN